MTGGSLCLGGERLPGRAAKNHFTTEAQRTQRSGLQSSKTWWRVFVVSSTAMDQDQALRESLGKLLDWEDAHINFDRAIDGIDPRKRGEVRRGLAHSLWQ